MSLKNPDFKDVYNSDPSSEKFSKYSPSNAVNALNSSSDEVFKIINGLYKIQRTVQNSNKKRDKNLAKFLKSTNFGTSTKNWDIAAARTAMFHKDMNPFGQMAKMLSHTSSKNVNAFMNVKDKNLSANRQAQMREIAKMAVNVSNALVGTYNHKKAAGASPAELKAIMGMWKNAKTAFMTKGVLADRYFSTVRKGYNDKTGRLYYMNFKKNKEFETQFYHDMHPNKKDDKDLIDALNDMSNSIGNWLLTMSDAFKGTTIGELLGIGGNSERVYSKLFADFDGATLGGFIKDRQDKFNDIKSSFKFGELRGTMDSLFNGDTSKWVTNPDGTMSMAKGSIKGTIGNIGKGLKGAAMATPVGAIAAAVGGIAKAAIGIFKFLAKSSPILQAVQDMMNLFFTLFFMPIGNALGDVILPLMTGLIDWVLKWNDLWSDFTWDKFGGLLWDMFSSLINGILSIPQAIWNLLVDMLHLLTSDLPLLLADFFDSVGLGFVADFFRDFGTMMGNAIRNIQNIVNDIFNSIKDFFRDPVAALSGVFSGAGDAIGDAWNGFLDYIGLASGGIVQPTPGGTLALLAEGGEPEAVIPLSEFDNIFGSTQPIVVNINGDVYGINDLETKIETVINRVSNRGAYR